MCDMTWWRLTPLARAGLTSRRCCGRMGAVVEIRSLLRDYLQGLVAEGENRLPVDDEARAVLRAWMLAARRGGARAAGLRAAAEAEQEAPLPAAAANALAGDEALQAEDDSSPAVNSNVAMLREALREENASAAEEEENELYFRPGGKTPEEAWQMAQVLLPRWSPLRELGTLRDTPVWGEGNHQADIMFVGDAPNYYDEQAGRPFCGEAGAKLDGMLKAMGLSRSMVYITHLVKFRPLVPRQTLNNRAPSKDEIRLSTPVLEFETRLVRPKVIVALGVIAARGLLQQGELPLAAYQQMEGGSFCGVPVIVTHHPSYLLRTSSLPERRRLWEEMLHVMQIAGLPISEKQRGYFLPKA